MEKLEFEILWRSGEPHVRTFLAAGCQDSVVVQDLTQEVALAAWRKRDQFDANRDFVAWVIGMARFTLLRHRRNLARRFVILAPDLIESLQETLVNEVETLDHRRQALVDCREKLGEPAKRLLALRFSENLSWAEVASRLGRTHGAIRTAFSRIRDWLRMCIEARLAGKTIASELMENP
jgi:RNA polymerase sigma-70 factor (ECF subfamily)